MIRFRSPEGPERLVRGAALALLIAVPLACGSDDEDWDDFDEAQFFEEAARMNAEFGADGGMPQVGAPYDDFPPPEFGYESDGAYDDFDADEGFGAMPGGDALGYLGYEQTDSGSTGGQDWGGDPGAFRGESQVGGVPTVSGTIDQSGEGNHVFSVGGKVIELP